jgi:hypothetical protein
VQAKWSNILIGPKSFAVPLGIGFLLNAPNHANAMNILDIQPFVSTEVFETPASSESLIKLFKLHNLNPNINIWHLLEVQPKRGKTRFYHLEVANPSKTTLKIDPAFSDGLAVTRGAKTDRCSLFQGELERAQQNPKKVRPYSAICGRDIYLRHPGDGQESTKEAVADFLRKHIWGGEEITTIVKDTFFKDKFIIVASANAQTNDKKKDIPKLKDAAINQPMHALIDAAYEGRKIKPEHLGIQLKVEGGAPLSVGQWYEAKQSKGIYFSIIEPKNVASDIMNSHKKRVKKLDHVERDAAAYLMAYDLDSYEVGYALGTKHPSLEWSRRARPEIRDSNIPGPDGIGTSAPLIATGSVNPAEIPRVVSTMTSGFKRTHAAFKWGELSKANRGSHYGFIQNGTAYSRLNPKLATVIIDADNRLSMKTWTKKDDEQLSSIKHARQNGVPIIEFDQETNQGIPAPFVGSWHLGNWSGSVDSKQRALRAGACIQQNGKKRFLIYGYFSSATPNAMARVFQSFQCQYALHLDMNALEHTYLALYRNSPKGLDVEHLIKGMDVLDKKSKKGIIPRFTGMPDNRDFFYILKKQ